MTVSSSQQLHMFAVCILLGIISGVLFDVLRSIRRIYGGGTFNTTLQDILFLLAFVFASIYLCYLYDDGRVRYYQVLGAIFGALIYSLFLSRIFLTVFCTFHRLFIKIIIVPLIKTAQLICLPIKKAGMYIIKKVRRLKKLIKNVYTHKKRIKKRLKLL